MKLFHFVSHNKKETEQAGLFLARAFLDAKKSGKSAIVIALKGELGAGKTTFIKGFARGLGVKKTIQSPTFVIAKPYSLLTTHYKLFVHIDAYRLQGGKDIKTLGWDEWIENPKHIILVEWADRIKDILPKHRFEIRFKHAGKKRRRVALYVF